MAPDQKKALKNWAYKKYRGRCAYCQRKLEKDEATLDHIVAVSLGGSNSRSNLALACLECNRTKGNTTPQLWRQLVLEMGNEMA